jgi:hypothetical protein
MHMGTDPHADAIRHTQTATALLPVRLGPSSFLVMHLPVRPPLPRDVAARQRELDRLTAKWPDVVPYYEVVECECGEGHSAWTCQSKDCATKAKAFTPADAQLKPNPLLSARLELQADCHIGEARCVQNARGRHAGEGNGAEDGNGADMRTAADLRQAILDNGPGHAQVPVATLPHAIKALLDEVHRAVGLWDSANNIIPTLEAAVARQDFLTRDDGLSEDDAVRMVSNQWPGVTCGQPPPIRQGPPPAPCGFGHMVRDAACMELWMALPVRASVYPDILICTRVQHACFVCTRMHNC